MLKRFTAILLLVALGAGVASGVPTHSGGEECGMHDVMDCCKRAREHGGAPEVAAARLCCAVNCQHSGTTGGSAAPRVSSPEAVSPHPAAPVPGPYAVTNGAPRRDASYVSSAASPPAYLLNLALLI